MTVNDERLLPLIEKKKSVERNLKEINNKILETRLAIAFERYGIKIGSIVASTAINTKGILHRVTRVDVSWYRDKPWVVGNPKRKDGTFGTTNRNLYNEWELVASGEP